MAKHTMITITDDLDGSEGASLVKFGLDGKNYEIDLSDDNAAALRKALAPYIEAGTRVTGESTAGSATTGRRKYGTGPARRDTKHIREWLRSQGVEISDRGRIPTDLMDRYNRQETAPAPKQAAPDPGFTAPAAAETKTAAKKAAPSRGKKPAAATA